MCLSFPWALVQGKKQNHRVCMTVGEHTPGNVYPRLLETELDNQEVLPGEATTAPTLQVSSVAANR